MDYMSVTMVSCMYVVELFKRKLKANGGEQKEESWVIVKKRSGKVVKKMSYKNYRKTKLPALANQNSPLARALLISTTV